MISAMPSPKSTNRERFFVVHRGARAAYDEMPKGMSDEQKLELVGFVRSRLNDADFGEFCKMLDIDPGIVADSTAGPEPFRGMPERGGGKFGEDSRHSKAFQLASRIKVSPY